MSDPLRRKSLASRAQRTAVLATLTLAAAASVATLVPASAASERVRNACTSDYLKFCSQYDPDSHLTVDCMKRHGNRLSRSCRVAFQEESSGSGKRLARR